MCEPLPERINAERLAQEHTRLAGVIPLEKMPRLAQCLAEPGGDASVEVDFAPGPAGRSVVRGEAAAKVRLVCQRCMGNVDWPLEARFSLALVHDDDEAAALPAEYEPLLWPDESGSLAALVEDELLLALPAVPRHIDPQECGTVERMMRPENDPDERRDNPFNVLSKLKRRDSSS
ncbi:MAG TPA: YceD family protein [Gammaproteobacteria bacterium]|nr:YceD family protein [Gammaproteobacteria bacterium]